MSFKCYDLQSANMCRKALVSGWSSKRRFRFSREMTSVTMSNVDSDQIALLLFE
ncbi:hypothetical protein TorRG33x02_007430, partial [Trema orientale]